MTEKRKTQRNQAIINKSKKPHSLDSGLIYESDFNTDYPTYPCSMADRIVASWRRDMQNEKLLRR